MTALIKYEPSGKAAGKAYGSAILSTPIRIGAYLPKSDAPKKSGGAGRPSVMLANIKILQADPGQWYRIAEGKPSTLRQNRVYALSCDNTLETEIITVAGQSSLVARARSAWGREGLKYGYSD